MQVSGLLTAFTALSMVVAFQLGGIKNDTFQVQDNVSYLTETSMPTENTSNFWFSLAGAIGSLATAAAFGFIIYQTRLTKKQLAQTQEGLSLTKKQVAQTQEEIENTLRPWLGIIQAHGKDIQFSIDSPEIDKAAKITVEYFLRNYGRVPAKITGKRYKWSKDVISKEQLYSEKIPDEWGSSSLQSLIFPDEVAMSSTNSDKQPFLPNETFYFGLLVEYDSGEGTRKREYGSIFRYEKDPIPSLLNLYQWVK